MNIFILSECPKEAARLQINKHVVKMILETAQLLCTTVHLVSEIETPYKPTHKNHPCSIWARESKENFLWLVEHGLELCDEYTRRYGKVHKSKAVIEWCFENLPSNMEVLGLTKFAQAMPEHLKADNAVTAYRNYYKAEKHAMLGKDERFRF